MGEPITDNNNESNADGSQSSSACSDQNGSCNGLDSKNFLQLNLNKVTPDLDYLTLLLKDKKQLAAFPNVFLHIERLLDDEINRVRVALFQCKFTREPLQLPEPVGEVTMRQEKVFVPIKLHPEYNFVGRILGPRGMTAKQLEAETGCKIMVRGKGSMRDKKKEDMNKGKANWEHLQEDLHVLIQCEDTPNRIEVKIKRAIEEVNKLLVPSPEGEDELKKKQLMELAIINGTYRTAANQLQNDKTQTVIAAAAAAATNCNKAALLHLEQQRLWANQGIQIPSVIYPSAITPNATATAVQSLGLTGAPLILQPTNSQTPTINNDRHSVNRVSAAVNNQQTANSAAFAAAAALQIAQLNGLNANTNAAMFSQIPQTAVVPNSATTVAAANGTVTPNQAIIDYQMLLNSMQCDPNILAQIQQQQIATFLQASGAVPSNNTSIGVNSANDVATAANFSQLINLNSQNTGALFSQQRRFLGQSRDHPYLKRET